MRRSGEPHESPPTDPNNQAQGQYEGEAGSRPTDVDASPSAKGKTDAELTADAVIEGIAANAFLLQTWSKYPLGTLDVTALVNSLDDATAAVNRGDMAAAESLLITQAVALNTIFVNLAARGHQATQLALSS